MKIIIATKNKGKFKEFKDLLNKMNMEAVSLLDLNYEKEIIEDGSTFIENAFIKARTIADEYNLPVLSDDSGLEVKVLNNEPGIYSARYAGTDCIDESNNDLLLENLKPYQNLKQRAARYVCAIALVVPGGQDYSAIGYCDGFIAFERKGNNGFGYDPIFYVEQYDKHMAEITLDEKHQISHRAQAFKELKKILKKF
jgi:XTP/dITP diphosphohydrolase